MNALADPQVGKYLNEHFISAFQKVATFRIVGQQKQGGNVATYFCAQDGRVLHVIAGPVDAATMLREARWVVDTVKKSLAETENRTITFKSKFREAHAERLRREHGLTVSPVTFDEPTPGTKSALSYRDPTGKALAPVLPPPPIEGPDVGFQAVAQEAAKKSAGARAILDQAGRRWTLGNQGRVHMLLAAHALKNIETVYGSVFEGILGEKVSTKPVEIVNPFPWVALR